MLLLSLLAVRGHQLPLRLPATHAPRRAATRRCGGGLKTHRGIYGRSNYYATNLYSTP